MKGEYLGMSVVINVGNQQFTGPQKQGALLVNYDESNDTYTGVVFPQNTKFTQFFASLGKGQFGAETPLNVGVVLRIIGLRRYPYAARPNYPFQFVLPGEDHMVLTELAAANYKQHQDAHIPPVEETVEEVIEEAKPEAVKPPFMEVSIWEKQGFASKQDWINAGKPGKV